MFGVENFTAFVFGNGKLPGPRPRVCVLGGYVEPVASSHSASMSAASRFAGAAPSLVPREGSLPGVRGDEVSVCAMALARFGDGQESPAILRPA